MCAAQKRKSFALTMLSNFPFPFPFWPLLLFCDFFRLLLLHWNIKSDKIFITLWPHIIGIRHHRHASFVSPPHSRPCSHSFFAAEAPVYFWSHNVLAMLMPVLLPHCVDVQRVTLSLIRLLLYLLLHWCYLLWSCNKTKSKHGRSKFGNKMFPKHEMLAYNDAQWRHKVKKKNLNVFRFIMTKFERS